MTPEKMAWKIFGKSRRDRGVVYSRFMGACLVSTLIYHKLIKLTSDEKKAYNLLSIPSESEIGLIRPLTKKVTDFEFERSSWIFSGVWRMWATSADVFGEDWGKKIVAFILASSSPKEILRDLDTYQSVFLTGGYRASFYIYRFPIVKYMDFFETL